ncbi:MAG: ComF family protein [Deltaproteobacteria bacterium]|nr:ComF family protein [Deltaproteobacteria bacterium]
MKNTSIVFLRDGLSFFFDLLYPPVCLSCGVQLHSTSDIFCPICNESLSRCNPYSIVPVASHLTRIISIFEHGGAMAHAINRMKYGNELFAGVRLADLFSKEMSEELISSNLVSRSTTVIPVPLHINRLRKRGFNQSAVLAKPLAVSLSLDYRPGLLDRIIDTKHQTGLTGTERSRNVKNAFAASAVVPEDILLVDDVFTTGATSSECARVLLKNGAKNVSVATLDRA